MARHYGRLSAECLFRAQWEYTEPEWYDHRLPILDPDTHFKDFWPMSPANVIQVLPFNGTLLDLCSGDGFFDYWFYRQRATVTAVERNQEAYDHAIKHHSHPKIQYILADVLTYAPEPDSFDVVMIRGAIEHFPEGHQQMLFTISHRALKPGGYFCGDTVAKQGADKMLSSHEHEWRDEWEMREALSTVFTDVNTWTLVSQDRTSLFWRCRK